LRILCPRGKSKQGRGINTNYHFPSFGEKRKWPREKDMTQKEKKKKGEKRNQEELGGGGGKKGGGGSYNISLP